ncbi:T9SS type A sorting domain-containing protein [Marixanthomonas ophiurae]|uniref:T9SS C-terminal target domain-containing protein n=1 Tax=Marixanthomonas ophiurae TaxID=387659 RepID=A0A3E1Q720_9FLAO|nr:T9SS type A sorting domain-containing protein [Marixanthomonas ophiurae]RFN57923.1 T9SS C-terminal target domain-containing protein [Marixanthomonas ophiurae]
MKTKLLFLSTLFFSFSIHAQIDFDAHITVNDDGGTNGASSVFAADLDGDEDMDMISSSSNDGKIAWYENINGNFGSQQIISNTRPGTVQVITIDIDGDGDQDIINSAREDGIVWYENTDGQANFASPQLVNTASTYAQEILARDMDGDGDFDVVGNGGENSSLAWYENMDGEGTFGTEHTVILTEARISSIAVEDMDGDGDMDILTTNYESFEGDISWYKNIDGQGSFGPQEIITTDVSQPSGASIADIDGDGDMDFFATSSFLDQKIIWFENVNGQGDFGTEHFISYDPIDPRGGQGTDIDNDGDIDYVYQAGFNQISFYKNDGSGNFGPMQQITDDVSSVRDIELSDLDNDGDLDVMSASSGDDKIAYYKNTNGQGSFGPQQIVVEINGVNAPYTVFSIDMDGDGDQDILSAAPGSDKIAWQKNLDGQGNFSEPITISQLDYPISINAADIDGDGDMDVVSESHNDHIVGWFENMDGLVTSFEAHLFPQLNDNPYITYPLDVDDDGDIDIISGGINYGIFYYENLNGQGNFGSPQVINNNFKSVESVKAVDLDGDGDMDLVAADWINDVLFWHENNGGGNYGPEQIISTELLSSYSLVSKDIDNDGDADIVASSFEGSSVVWFENIDGQGTFGPLRVIDDNVSGAYEIYAEDLDSDGDIDVLSAIYFDNTVYWYENDGTGNFGEPQIISSNVNGATCIFADDFNGDGKMDVLASSQRNDEIIWFENLGPLAIEENLANSFSIYPNPTTGLLNVKSNSPISEIIIYNSIGQLLITFKEKNQVDISGLSEGIYFVKIINESGRTETKKVVKKIN